MVAPYPDAWDIPEDVEKLVIPSEYQLTFLRYFHIQPDSAHRGREATLSSVGRSFWWSNMAKSVKSFCKHCLGCQLRKSSHDPLVGRLRTSIYTKPFSAIGVDLIEMPPGESDVEGHPYHFIFHAVCLFSNYVITRPLRSKSMMDVAKCLFNEVICHHGYFGTIRSDRGKEFCNSLLDELYKFGNVEVQRTSSLRAQFNGQCERAHRFPMDALAILCSGREDRWPHFLQPVTFAHNTNPGNGRLFSPYFITHGGRNPPTLPDLLLKSGSDSSCEPSDLEIDSMAVDMVESMKTAHVCVRLALLDARLKAKNKYDKNRSVPDFVEGDFVGLRAPPRRSKLSLKWRGPYIVSDPCNNTVLLKSVPHGPPTTGTRVNVDRLIHLNLSGDLNSTIVEGSVIDNQHGLVNLPAISEA
ncbi:retrovirus polyprotein, putative, partial [Perkinsus marinus ATCC 50983]